MGSAPRTRSAAGKAARSRRLGLAASVGVHAVLALVLLAALGAPPAYLPAIDPPIIPLSLVARPEPKPEPGPPGGVPAPPAPASAVPPPKARPARSPPPEVTPLPVRSSPEPAPLPSLSAAELAGARTAGSGGGEGGGAGAGGDGGCDMVRRLERALRGDAEVRQAAAGAHRAAGGGGRAVVVWNGDWILSPGQSGKGLAGVRQAIALEVAFAPEGCRAEPMRGLVVLAMADGPDAPRLALGTGRWRWTDLLGARRR